MPPDICIELILWERFKWGPKDTENMTLKKMKELFAVLEQQRVSRDAVENLGPPTLERYKQITAGRYAEQEAVKEREKTPI